VPLESVRLATFKKIALRQAIPYADAICELHRLENGDTGDWTFVATVGAGVWKVAHNGFERRNRHLGLHHDERAGHNHDRPRL